ncbi:MAG TPA: diacylglycerol kinase family protein [Naasia sp.]
MPHVLVAANPIAAFGRRASAGEQVIAALQAAGAEAELLVAPSAADLPRLLAAAVRRSRPELLAVVGGDGMVHAGIQVASAAGVPLGIVPTGTGNDLARGLGIPLGDPGAAGRILLSGADRRIDLLRVRTADGAEMLVAGAVSAGFDALVSERANGMRRPRGASRYTLAMLRELVGLRPISYTLTLDGAVRREPGVLIAVANNSSIGGGMRIAPDADLADGVADILFVRPLGRLRFAALFPRVFRGRHVGLRPVRMDRAKVVRIEAGNAVVAYGDGERLGPLPVDIEVLPAAILVRVPA